jgi:hypothetical protein
MYPDHRIFGQAAAIFCQNTGVPSLKKWGNYATSALDEPTLNKNLI